MGVRAAVGLGVGVARVVASVTAATVAARSGAAVAVGTAVGVGAADPQAAITSIESNSNPVGGSRYMAAFYNNPQATWGRYQLQPTLWG